MLIRPVLQNILTLVTTVYLSLFSAYLILRYMLGDGVWWLSLVNTFAYGWFLPLLILVPLALLLRQRRAVVRLAPVVAVAGLWFGSYYVPTPTVNADGPMLQVIAANVWGNNHDLSSIEDWLRETNADVLILQEISPTYATDNLPALLDLYPYQMNQVDETRWGGNLTLSRYPILEWEYVDLQLPNHAPPLRLVIDFEGQPVAIYNVHLAWPGHRKLRAPLPERWNTLYTQIVFGFDDQARNRQITNLLKHLETEPWPYIVGGDFNTSDQSMTYQQIAGVMIDSFRETGNGFQGSWPVSVVRGLPAFLPPLIRIDYIWHSDDFRAIDARLGHPIGSDHLPMLATLTLTESQQAGA